MKRVGKVCFGVLVAFVIASCAMPCVPAETSERVHVTIVHFNDIYEIAPLDEGKKGGIARVATLRDRLLARNPNTITMLGGDLFSPSAVGTAKYDGDRLAGRQMVDVLNHFGLDYATFGNHEFDVNETQFDKRMQEAKFTWISSNVFDEANASFPGVKKQLIIPFSDPETGAIFRLGVFGVTLRDNDPDYVHIVEPMAAAKKELDALNGKADFILALTHQSLADDEKLVSNLAGIDLLLGGHEHMNYQRWRGKFIPILKGDSNVRSVYIVDLYFDPKTRETEVRAQLMPIDKEIVEQPALKKVVDEWMQIAFDAFRKDGFEPEATVTTTTEPLDGLESSVRFRQTNLTRTIAKSMLRPYPEADLSVYNSGSIRIDDVLPPGKITEYDVIRILPYKGKVRLASIEGKLLESMLNAGESYPGDGAFLQSSAQKEKGTWRINGHLLVPSATYRVAINDYLADGEQSEYKTTVKDAGFSIINAGDGTDMRKLLIEELR